MRGFFVSNFGKHYDFINNNDLNNYESIIYDKYYIVKNYDKKFSDDKLFNITKDYFILLNGVILNKSKLIDNSPWIDTIVQMINNGKYSYFDSLRGNFCGGHYEIDSKEWVFYTNTISYLPLFYCYCNGNFIVSTDFLAIVNELKSNYIELTINNNSIYNMLSYGFMFEDQTYFNEIHKLPYGCYIKVNDKKIDLIRYYDFDYSLKEKSDVSEDVIIDKVDELFRDAVKLEFEKDKEYGYNHISTLSGGLDSRMVSWVAKDLGFNNILNLNFCQSDCLDEKIAKQVSQKLNTELIVKSLNDGCFIKDFESIIKMNFGMVTYDGISHGNSLYKYMNFNNFGLLHSGEVGDAILSSFHHGKSVDKFPGSNSRILVDKSKNQYLGNENIEKFKMKSRVFNGITYSMLARSIYTETSSPFLYRDFFDFCIKEIPYHLRDNHYIYKKWILKKYPLAAAIPVERYNNCKINDPNFIIFINKIKKIGISKIFAWFLWKLGLVKSLNTKSYKNNMNPFDKWYNLNNDIKTYLDNYYKSEITNLQKKCSIDNRIIDDIINLYENGKVTEKMQVITVLASLKMYL